MSSVFSYRSVEATTFFLKKKHTHLQIQPAAGEFLLPAGIIVIKLEMTVFFFFNKTLSRCRYLFYYIKN